MNTPKSKPVVLSADDDDDAHVLLKMAFTRAGSKAALLTVKDGCETIRYLSGEGKFSDRNLYPLPEVLLLDLKMPKVSGFGVLEHLRKQADLQNMPVIVLSSSDNEGDVRRAQALGCYAYVLKPTNFNKLIEFVSAIDAQFFSEPGQLKLDVNFSRFDIGSKAVEPRKSLPELKPAHPYSESPDLFRLLVEQVKDYAIFMLDKDGIILSWNEGARRIKGYEAEEIVGKHFSIFYPPQDKELRKPNFELRKAQDMGRYEDEGWRVRKDGSRFWADVVITPLYEPGGKLLGFAKVTRDLTQRKLQEENFQSLLDSEERFRLLVDQVKDYAIFVLDAKGNINSWNQGARRLKGYSADEVMGKHFSIFYTPEDLLKDHPTKELNIAVREGRYEEEGWRVRKDGSRFWANVVITSLWDKRGNLSGFAKVTRDLSQKKQQEDALKHRTEELESFAQTLSHDLRSPLRAISGFGQILVKESSELSEKEKLTYAQKIVKSAHKMEELINGVLKLSQVSVAPVSEELVDLAGVFDESLTLLEAEIQQTEARIDIRKPLPFVKTSRILLVQIFTNLLGNALKFAIEGQAPKLEVFTVTKNGHCEIHVKDYGVGIPEQFQHSIFNAFERGAADSNTSGTGIGLAIVKKAVERIGGNVEVKSAEGKGSDFIVTLPCEISVPLAV